MIHKMHRSVVWLCLWLAVFVFYAGYVEPYWVEVTLTPNGQMQEEMQTIVIGQVSVNDSRQIQSPPKVKSVAIM